MGPGAKAGVVLTCRQAERGREQPERPEGGRGESQSRRRIEAGSGEGRARDYRGRRAGRASGGANERKAGEAAREERGVGRVGRH